MMTLSEFCIKRPVFATVLSFILIALGLVGYVKLNTRFFPKFQTSKITVNAYFPGASAKLMETSVTTPLEKNLSTLDGVETISSSSEQGASQIKLTLKPDANAFEVANVARNQVAFTASELPSNMKTPTVVAGRGTSELIDLGITSDSMDLNALRDYLNRYVVNTIQEIPGVASYAIWGANPYAMRVWLDPQKMAARNVSITAIESAIQNANVGLPAGKITSNYFDLPITAQTKLYTAAEFGDIVVKNAQGDITKLKDVATVQLGTDNNQKMIVRINGKRGLLLQIYNNDAANPIQTADRIKATLKTIQAQLPAGVHIIPSWDQSLYMKASVREVADAILISILCVVMIIFLFLGKIRSALIPIVTIPICLIATFGILYFMGFTINVITLLAIVLSIGLIVDDAIVVLENIHRHILEGKSPFQAACLGSREITFAVIAMTLTLAAVYAPVGLVQGMGANLFKSFAYTLAGAVILSGFISLTLSPMMCARILKAPNENPTRRFTPYAVHLENFFTHLKRGYEKLLSFVLRFHWVIVLMTVGIAVGGFFLFKSTSKAFVPQEDMGFLISTTQPKAGITPETIDQQLQAGAKILQLLPGVLSTMTFTSSGLDSFNAIFTLLQPYAKRTQSASALAKQVNQAVAKRPSLNLNTFPPSFGGGMKSQLQFYLVGSRSYDDLSKITQTIISKLKQTKKFSMLTTDLNFDQQGYDLTINRPLANQLGVSARQINTTLEVLLGGTSVSTFERDGQNYYVYLQAKPQYRQSVESLENYPIRTANNTLITLGTFAQIQPTLSQSTREHYNSLRAAMINSNLATTFTLGEAVGYLQKMLPQWLPSDVKFVFTGNAKRILDSSNEMGFIFLLSILFIYLILSAQFESFLDPLIILLAVPLSIVGALAALKLFHGSINVYTAIGFVTLIGLVSKHGILITSFANKLRAEGLPYDQALIQAAGIRLRPILMTTAAMVFGALPLLLSNGAGAASRHQIGIVIIGGLLCGTFFSLVLVPVFYLYAAKLKRFVQRRLLRRNHSTQ